MKNKRKIKFNKDKQKMKNSKPKNKNVNEEKEISENKNMNENTNIRKNKKTNKKQNKDFKQNKKNKQITENKNADKKDLSDVSLYEKDFQKVNDYSYLDEEDRIRILKLEDAFRYKFKNKNVALDAITHKSYAYENNTKYNERLEFLGDSILGFTVAEKLYLSENVNEGKMSKERAYIVCEDSLYEIARMIGMKDILRYGGGVNNLPPKAVLADSIESVIAAIYLDSNIDIVKRIILNIFKYKIADANTKSEFSDYKSAFQEIIGKRGNNKIAYVDGYEKGPDHNKTFEVWLMLDGKRYTRGIGKSKKAAEIEAAKAGIEKLNKENGEYK